MHFAFMLFEVVYVRTYSNKTVCKSKPTHADLTQIVSHLTPGNGGASSLAIEGATKPGQTDFRQQPARRIIHNIKRWRPTRGLSTSGGRIMVANELTAAIAAHAQPKLFPDSTPYSSLSSEYIHLIALQFKNTAREIEIAALQKDIIPERYTRNMKMLSVQDQIRLLSASATIVGLGGLGGSVTEILARAGVGHLNLIDGDVFEESNLNRQLMSTADTIGTSKADAAAKRVGLINPSIAVHSKCVNLDEHNAPKIIESPDVVVDCLDNIRTRFILERAAKKKNVPLVSAAVAGVSGHITTIFPQDEGLKLVFGDRITADGRGAEAALGNLPSIVNLTAAYESSEVIKILLNRGMLLRNKLQVIDLMDNTFEIFDLK